MAGDPKNGGSAPDAGNAQGDWFGAWFKGAEDSVATAVHSGASAVAKTFRASTHELQTIVDRLSRAGTWAELESIVNPILGGISLDFGFAVGLAESVGDLIKGLFDLQKMLVLAALYEEITGLQKHSGRSIFIEATTDLIPGFLPAKVIATGLGAGGGAPSWLEEMKHADEEVRAIVTEVGGFIRHPIDGLVNFATNKWAARWKTWQECIDWWNQYNALYASGEPGKMYLAGVMLGKLTGNVALTVLAIWSMYGMAVRAAQLVAIGSRVALGLVTLEAAEAEVLAADAALTASKAERAAAEVAKDSAKIAEAAKNATAAGERLKAARLQKTLVQLQKEAPRLLNRLKDIEEVTQSKAEVGDGGATAETAAPAPERAVPDAEPKTARVSKGEGQSPPEPKGGRAVGGVSGRPFDPDMAGGPIQELSVKNAQITHEGIDALEQHIARFGPDDANTAMVNRLRSIASGDLAPTEYDLNYYTHELREAERYTNLGWPQGQPLNPDDAYELWNNAHTATLEDYGLKDGQLYHPDALK